MSGHTRMKLVDVPAFRVHSAVPGVAPRIVRALRQVLVAGVLAVLLLPVARGYSAWVGWMPLWLVAMPLSALWAAHGFRLPRRTRASGHARRWYRPQARRRGSRMLRSQLPRAA